MERVERLTNLVAVLLDTSSPLTLEELVQRIPGYPESISSYQRQFERDKETLRAIGVPIHIEALDPLGKEVGYRIVPSEYYLPDLGLTREEQEALNVVLTAVHMRELGTAGQKLGIPSQAERSLIEIPSSAALHVLFEGFRSRQTVTFVYRGASRKLQPHGIALRNGRWYVVGFDIDRDALRTFRVDRIESEVVIQPGDTYEIPEHVDVDALIRTEFVDTEEEPAKIVIDPEFVPIASTAVGRTVEMRNDGSAIFEMPVSSRAAFRDWLLDWGEHVRVLGPSELRNEIIGWLETSNV